MKKTLLVSLLGIGIVFDAYSQKEDTAAAVQKKEYEAFISQILSSNGNAVLPSITVEAAEDPALKFNLPFFPLFWGEKKYEGSHYVSVAGKISTTNGYSLFTKGEWQPDADISAGYTWILPPSRKYFYVDEIIAGSPLFTKPISEASSIRFFWLNAKIGYNYAEYNFYDSTAASFDDKLFTRHFNSVYFNAGLNFYYFPSRRKADFLSIYGNIGLNYKSNDNNYDLLSPDEIKQKYVYTDGANGVTEIASDEGTYRSGNFIVGNAYSAFANTTFLFSTSDRKFYMGLGLHGTYKNLAGIGTANFGLSLNLPVQKSGEEDTKTILNLALRVDFNDVGNKLGGRGSFRDRLEVGFTVGVPIITHRAPKE